MAKNGFSVMDSDMHIVEPNDLFERYLDAPYKNQAPKITRVRGQRVGVFLFDGHASRLDARGRSETDGLVLDLRRRLKADEDRPLLL
jgi:predicted signal transduction protein with EAL and GGDEF domain